MAANAGSEARLHETVSVMLHAQKQRLTPTRKRIVEVLEAADRPLTITEILDAQPDLPQSSAYRNLVVLEQARVVHRLVTHADFARYELAEDLTGHHHHLVCSNCGRVDDLPATAAVERSVAIAIDEAASRAGFRTEHHRLDLIGLCSDCAP
jgi:Fur family transcriptional regulator, ferric uptake regulator